MSNNNTQNTTNDDDSSSLDNNIPPRIRPRSIYDSDSRMKPLQNTYDNQYLDMQEKHMRKEKRLQNQAKKRKKRASDIAA